jgi:hypothetical protein
MVSKKLAMISDGQLTICCNPKSFHIVLISARPKANRTDSTLPTCSTTLLYCYLGARTDALVQESARSRGLLRRPSEDIAFACHTVPMRKHTGSLALRTVDWFVGQKSWVSTCVDWRSCSRLVRGKNSIYSTDP